MGYQITAASIALPLTAAAQERYPSKYLKN